MSCESINPITDPPKTFFFLIQPSGLRVHVCKKIPRWRGFPIFSFCKLYPTWLCQQLAMENGHLITMDFPMKNYDFP